MPVFPARAVRAVLAALAAAALTAGCANLPAARMALPAALEGVEPVVPRGLTYGREGRFQLPEARVSYRRGADRLSLFGALDIDRAAVSYTLERDGHAPVHTRCQARRQELTLV